MDRKTAALQFGPLFTLWETPNQEGGVIISYRAEQLGNLANVWTDNKLVLFPCWYDFILSEHSCQSFSLSLCPQSDNSKSINQLNNIRKSKLSYPSLTLP